MTDSTPGGPPRVLVVGTGLLGTSIGLALSAAGWPVWLTDAKPGNARIAAERGAGRADEVPDDVDLVVVAVPPSVTADVVAEALDVHRDATVTDVASVKDPVIESLRGSGADLSRFVGGHPMSGREVSGPRAARTDLFESRPWVLTPTAESEPERVQLVTSVVDVAGGVVRVLSPDIHDHAVALTSHAPQVVASLMAARLAEVDDATVSVSGQGLRDVVRIASSDPDLWADILMSNASAVAPVLTELAADLERLGGALSGNASRSGQGGSAGEGPGELRDRNVETIASILALGNDGAERLPAKHGGEATSYITLPVVVEDAPGALGRLFLAAGEADVNLEDVRIEHTVGRMTAIAHLSVLPAAVAELRSALAAGGWHITG